MLAENRVQRNTRAQTSVQPKTNTRRASLSVNQTASHQQDEIVPRQPNGELISIEI